MSIVAPELSEEKYDEKVNIYAFGMCFIDMTSKNIHMKNISKVTEKKQPYIVRQMYVNCIDMYAHLLKYA